MKRSSALHKADAPKVEDPAVFSRALLERAFAQFNESSKRLEERYHELSVEAAELRAELKRKDEEVKRSEKLAVLGEYSAALAHEVRNPLGAIKLFASLLRDQCKENQGATQLTGDLLRSVSSLEATISNVLQFSRAEALPKVPLNFHSVLLDEVNCLQKRLGSGVTIELQLEAAPFLVGNEQGLRQVISNLLINSAQAMKGSGAVVVTTSDSVRDIAYLKLTVRDFGPGIPAQVRERLFEPFVTSKTEGTGLGLAMVKRVIDEHGGHVAVASEPTGTLFTIEIPRKAVKKL